jgi:hypothetical protein
MKPIRIVPDNHVTFFLPRYDMATVVRFTPHPLPLILDPSSVNKVVDQQPPHTSTNTQNNTFKIIMTSCVFRPNVDTPDD